MQNITVDQLRELFNEWGAGLEARLEASMDRKLNEFELRMDGKLAVLKSELIQRMDDGFAGIADVIDQIHKTQDGHSREIKSHDRRLTNLEAAP